MDLFLMYRQFCQWSIWIKIPLTIWHYAEWVSYKGHGYEHVHIDWTCPYNHKIAINFVVWCSLAKVYRNALPFWLIPKPTCEIENFTPNRKKKKKKKNYSTRYSHLVSYDSTDRASTRLSSQIGRDAELSGVYGRSWKLYKSKQYVLDDFDLHHSSFNRLANQHKLLYSC